MASPIVCYSIERLVEYDVCLCMATNLCQQLLLAFKIVFQTMLK